MADKPPILVGIDGSSSAEAAARWAAREAVVRGARLRVAFAYGWPGQPHARDTRRPEIRYRDLFLGYGRDCLNEVVARLRREYPALEVGTELVAAQPVTMLTDLSAEASLVVLGSRGLGGVSGLLLGSVAVGVVSHASCPVVIVRGEQDRELDAAAPVVVGLDGSPRGEAALAYAFDAADWYGAPLVAAHAWHDVGVDPAIADALWLESAAEFETRMLAEQLAGWGEKYPDVEVRRRIVRDRPAHALLAESRTARLLVVGARGRGGMAGLLLGSTSQAMIQRAACPVAVVRDKDR